MPPFGDDLREIGVHPVTAAKLEAEIVELGFTARHLDFLGAFAKAIAGARLSGISEIGSDVSVETLSAAEVAEELVRTQSYRHTFRFFSDRFSAKYNHRSELGGEAINPADLTLAQSLTGREGLVQEVIGKFVAPMAGQVQVGRSLAYAAELIPEESGKLRYFALTAFNAGQPRRSEMLYIVSMYSGLMAERIAKEPAILIETLRKILARGSFNPNNELAIDSNLELKGYKSIMI